MPATAKTAAKAKTAASKPAEKSAQPGNPAARPLKKGDHLFLVDGSGYIFRA
jgi:DNA polymerase-1